MARWRVCSRPGACLVRGPGPVIIGTAAATGHGKTSPNGPAPSPRGLVLAPADDGVLQAYRVAMVKLVARDPTAGVLLALSAVFMLTGAALVVLVSRAGWGLLAVGALLSAAAVVKALLRAAPVNPPASPAAGQCCSCSPGSNSTVGRPARGDKD